METNILVGEPAGKSEVRSTAVVDTELSAMRSQSAELQQPPDANHLPKIGKVKWQPT
jgi:hypothetical protein